MACGEMIDTANDLLNQTISRLETAIGYRFRDSNQLRMALTHRSRVNEETSKGSQHNERLEFWATPSSG